MAVKRALVFLLLLSFLSYSECTPTKLQKPPIEEKPLVVPPMESVVEALKSGLASYFETVDVSMVDCPDLTKEPFSLVSEGLSGSPIIMEVGSESYLLPRPQKEKVYDVKDICEQINADPAFVLGAGAGPFHYVGTASEYIANMLITSGKVHSRSQIAREIDNHLDVQTLPEDMSTCAFMTNFFISQGKPGKVIKVKVTKRIGNDDFATAVRSSLRKGFPGIPIGMGGTFLVTGSKIRQHVQPDFSETPLTTNEMRDNWLKFYNMNSPLVAVGMLITEDPGLKLRGFHFHSFSDHCEAGHYHNDIEPNTVEYLAYFNLASKVVRVDKPQ